MVNLDSANNLSMDTGTAAVLAVEELHMTGYQLQGFGGEGLFASASTTLGFISDFTPSPRMDGYRIRTASTYSSRIL